MAGPRNPTRQGKKQPAAKRQQVVVSGAGKTKAKQFVPETSECYSTISVEKQQLCIEVANDLEVRQQKLSQETRWLNLALGAAVSSILYNREIYDKDMFRDMPLTKTVQPKKGPETKTISIKMLKNNHPANIKMLKIFHDLSKAIEVKKLDGVDFGVVVDPNNPQSMVYEIYRFQFYYDSVQPSFVIRSQNNKVLARCAYSSEEDVGYAISVTLRSLSKVMSKLEKIDYATALSTHARVSDNFPLNRKRFHHTLVNGDYEFVNLEGRVPKKLRIDGYQDRASGIDCQIESVLVKDEYTTIANTTAMEQTICTEPEVPRDDAYVDHNISGIADNVEGLHINEEGNMTTPLRTSVYGLRVPISGEQEVLADLASPSCPLEDKTPSISPSSSRF